MSTGSPSEALSALPSIAAKAQLANYQTADPLDAAREYRAGIRMGATLICAGSPHYPDAFFDLNDPPAFLWARGNLDILKKPLASVIGARNASSLGMRMAEKIAFDLGQAGFGIVSGLARGIDTAAHRGALESGTIGILAGGVDNIYPEQNIDLAQKMLKTGLLLSEMSLGSAPITYGFRARNRLIAALGMCTTIAEATAKSGSLMTANCALDIGRDVFAVPGHPFDQRSAGTNNLIRDGSTLIRSANDILEAIGPINKTSTPVYAAEPSASPYISAPQKPPPILDNAAEPAASPCISAPQKPPPILDDTAEPAASLVTKILTCLSVAPLSEDQLLNDLAMPNKIVAQCLLDLELNDQITRQEGGMLARKHA